MSTEKLLIVGSGGHALVVLDALQRSGMLKRFSVDLRDGNQSMAGVAFLSYEIQYPEFPAALPTEKVFFHLAIGNAKHRCSLFEQGRKFGFNPLSIVHSEASISQYADIGAGNFIAAKAIVAPVAKTGCSVIINHGAVVDHEVQVGDFVHIAPNVTLGGQVVVGSGTLIGAGAVVLPGCKIGENCVIGAGAVVTRNLSSNSRVVGVPARALKD